MSAVIYFERLSTGRYQSSNGWIIFRVGDLWKAVNPSLRIRTADPSDLWGTTLTELKKKISSL